MENETLELGSEVETTENQLEAQETVENPEQQETEGFKEGEEKPEETTDGLRGPQNIRQALKAASEASPDHAQTLKELGNSYFREQAYKTAFPTTAEAQNARNLIDALGGLEGAQALQSRVQEYDQQETALEASNPAVLDSFFKDYPKQAVDLAGEYLDRVGKQNPQALQEAIGPYAVQLIETSGLPQYIAAALNETDVERKDQYLKQISDYLSGQVQNSKQYLQNRTQRESGTQPLAKEREEISKEREELFDQGVQSRVDQLSLPAIDGEVEKYSKQYSLNEDQKKYFWSQLHNKVRESLENDKTYRTQVDIRRSAKNRTHQGVADYISGEYNRRVKQEAFAVLKSCENVFGTLKGATQKQTTGQIKAGGQKTAPSGGPLYVSQRPQDAELDLSRQDAEINLIMGRAWTKSGKFITWRK